MLSSQIEQVAFAIVFEDGAEDPAVAVIIGELGVLQLRIQFRDLLEKIRIAPKPTRGRRFRIVCVSIARVRRRSDSAAPPDT